MLSDTEEVAYRYVITQISCVTESGTLAALWSRNTCEEQHLHERKKAVYQHVVGGRVNEPAPAWQVARRRTESTVAPRYFGRADRMISDAFGVLSQRTTNDIAGCSSVRW